MKNYLYLIIFGENSYVIENDFSLLIERIEKKIKYLLQKAGVLIIFVILIFLSKNIDYNFLSNEILYAKKKKFHYFTKYFKNNTFVNKNSSELKQLALINEIIYLHNIRKEINNYKNISFSNI